MNPHPHHTTPTLHTQCSKTCNTNLPHTRDNTLVNPNHSFEVCFSFNFRSTNLLAVSIHVQYAHLLFKAESKGEGRSVRVRVREGVRVRVGVCE